MYQFSLLTGFFEGTRENILNIFLALVPSIIALRYISPLREDLQNLDEPYLDFLFEFCFTTKVLEFEKCT